MKRSEANEKGIWRMWRKSLPLFIAMMILAVVLVGCSVLEPEPVDGYDYYGDYYKDHYRRPVQLTGVIGMMPSESAGPICGTVGVSYCRIVVGLFRVPYETDVVSIRWEFDGRPIPEGNDLQSFPYSFAAAGEHHATVTVVDEFDRTVIYDGPFRVVNPRSDYSNPWYTY